MLKIMFLYKYIFNRLQGCVCSEAMVEMQEVKRCKVLLYRI